MGCAECLCKSSIHPQGIYTVNGSSTLLFRRSVSFGVCRVRRQIYTVNSFLKSSGPENAQTYGEDTTVRSHYAVRSNSTNIAGLWAADQPGGREWISVGTDNQEIPFDPVLPSLQVQSIHEQEELSASPIHLEGLHAMYGTYVASCFMERVWRFISPMILALLHQSLLPVALLGFVGQLVIFAAGPWVGAQMDSRPRVLAFHILSVFQTISMLISAGVICYILQKGLGEVTTATSLLIKPWFLILILASGVERLTGLASGVAIERDWVVLLAGSNRPIALAEANGSLRRIEMLCEIIGPCVFGLLLSRCGPGICIVVAAAMMVVSLPILIALVRCTDQFSSGVLHRSKLLTVRDGVKASELFSHAQIATVAGGVPVFVKGWIQYFRQPVLPASLAYVLLYFNAVLSPGGLMTSFLTHHGINPSMVGFFRGMCAFMGFVATFASTSVIGKLGVLKAGAAALICQAALLIVAVMVYWVKPAGHHASLAIFLSLIVLSRLGHWIYDIVDAQIFQTGIPAAEANSVGTVEMSLASLAELVMLGVAIVANDPSYFGWLSALSMLSVAGAAGIYWHWLAHPTVEQQKLFPDEIPRGNGRLCKGNFSCIGKGIEVH